METRSWIKHMNLPSLLSSSVSEVTETGDWIGLLAVLDSCVARLMLKDDKASDSDCDSSSIYRIGKINGSVQHLVNIKWTQSNSKIQDTNTRCMQIRTKKIGRKKWRMELTRISLLFAFDFSLVLIQFLIRDSVERIFGIRCLVHHRIVLETTLYNTLASGSY